ncbi:uncharacterized protein LAESUDRAFT_749072 [Laetiporus sulphureus 93-53]|uniref:Nucleotidyltransferase n=1 Tax=Laetiporus sulphureus 93-53 TaxID=1314785 RepID=A0A165F2C5_9APHY|nr:uncharacterized protein LAESUDRAFT_749072 [Laetiporus sulphureus 93-53]KZT08226.1 hypothetical protein LAESUDRAFT_749072 [Laetiporus sulphureus 93-53]
MQRPASVKELAEVSSKAVSVFKSSHLSSCVVGDLACALYGTSRRPVDVDLMVMTRAYEPEKLKQLLTKADTTFYLASAKDTHSSHKFLCSKLYYRPNERKRGCIFHILVPGTLHLPHIPQDKINSINGIPVMPVILLVFMKLQIWSDRRGSYTAYMKSKQHDEDVRDIAELLAIARSRGESISKDSLAWLPMATVDSAMPRVKEYVAAFPNTLTNWRAIGYR